MITCTEAVRQLWEYLENNLGASDRESVEEHLTFCRSCCGEVEFAEALRELLRSSTRPHVPPDVEERLARSLEALEEEA